MTFIDEFMGGGDSTPAPEDTPTTTTRRPSLLDQLGGGGQSQPQPQPDTQPSGGGSSMLDMLDPYKEQRSVNAGIDIAVSDDFDDQATLDTRNDILQGLARINAAVSDDERESAQELIGARLYAMQESGLLDDVDLTQYGLEEVDIPSGPNWFQRGAGYVIDTPGISQVLTYFDRLNQGFWTGISALSEVTDEQQRRMDNGESALDVYEPRFGTMFAAFGRGLTYQEQPDDFYGLDLDQNDDGRLGFREGYQLDPNLGGQSIGGYALGALDIVLDPSTWTGLGNVGKARIGLRAAGDVGGDAAVAAIRRGGLRSLPDAMQEAIEIRTRELAVEAVEGGARRNVSQLLRRVDVDDIATRADDIAGRNLNNMGLNWAQARVRSGLGRIPGRRQWGDFTEVAPTQSPLPGGGLGPSLPSTFDRFAAPVTRQGVRGGRAYERLAGAFDFMRPRAKTQRRLGETAENAVDDFRVRLGGLPEAQADDLARQLQGARTAALRERRGILQRVRGARKIGEAEVIDDLNALAREALEGGSRQIDVLTGDANRRLARQYLKDWGFIPPTPARPKALSRVSKMQTQGLERLLKRGASVEEVAEYIARITGDSTDDIAEIIGRKRQVWRQDPDHVDRVLSGAGEAEEAYVRALIDAREMIDDYAVRAGLDVTDLNQSGYMPRVLTREGRELVGNNAALADDIGMVNDAVGQSEFAFQRARDARFAGMTTDEVNESLVRTYGLPEGTQVFNDDPLAAFAIRGRSAFQAAMVTDLMDGMTRELVDGVPLAIWDDGVEGFADTLPQLPGTEAAQGLGWDKVSTPAGDVWMPADVAKEVRQIRDVIVSDESLRKFSEFANEWSKTWGTWATSPLVDGIGFHSRNATGNIMLNAVKGIVNPKTYLSAQRVQRKLYKVRKIMEDRAISFDEAMSEVRMSRRQEALINGVREWGIVGDGFFDDLKVGEDTAAVWRFLNDNGITNSGRALGSMVEHNARIAHYIHQLDAGFTPADAARSVRQTLFDYGDLTAVERRLKMASRFYTFMRKNTAFQLWALTHHPGRVAAMERLVDDNVNIHEVLGLQQPSYSGERGDNILDPFGLKGAVVSVDTPFSAAGETLRPFLLTAGNVAGLTDANREELARAYMDLTSGGPRALADFMYESITGVDTFTGAPADTGKEQTAMAMLDALVGPAWSQIDRGIRNMTRGEGFGPIGNDETGVTRIGSDEEDPRLIPEVYILSNLLGLNVAPYGDSYATSQLYAMLEQIEAEAKDGNLPTVTQLRQAGLLPPAPESIRRAESISVAEDIAELEAQGLPTEALEQRYQEALISEREQGYRIAEDGSYTTRNQRLAEFATQQGILTEDGNPSTSKLSKVLFSLENPNDAYLDDDGTPLDEYDIPVRWYNPSQNDVLLWAQQNGAPLSENGNVTKATQAAWNAAFPENPYWGKTDTADRIEQGLTPVQGIFVTTDGQEIRGAVTVAEILRASGT